MARMSYEHVDCGPRDLDGLARDSEGQAAAKPAWRFFYELPSFPELVRMFRGRTNRGQGAGGVFHRGGNERHHSDGSDYLAFFDDVGSQGGSNDKPL
jgi:hypothetical protein